MRSDYNKNEDLESGKNGFDGISRSDSKRSDSNTSSLPPPTPPSRSPSKQPTTPPPPPDNVDFDAVMNTFLKRNSGPEKAAPPDPNTVPESRRGMMRDKLLACLEDDGGYESYVKKLEDIIQSGNFNMGILQELRNMPISKPLLRSTGIGRFLHQNQTQIGPAAIELEKFWREQVSAHIATCFKIESMIYEKNFGDTTGSPVLAAKNNNGWKYAQDIRSIISLLKKDYNYQTKRDLHSGMLSAIEFVKEFEMDPAIFESPQRKAQKTAADKELNRFVMSLQLPLFDADMTCPRCDKKGISYDVLHIDGSFSARSSEGVRKCQFLCQGCQHQWRNDE